MMCAGVDVGSITAKAVIYDASRGQIIGAACQLTGWSPRESGSAALYCALDAARLRLDDVATVVGTGYGRAALPFANHTVTEISCHARGAHFLFPQVRTVIDIGGQDSKVIALDDTGHPRDFAMNDRCAAGTGRFFQVIAGALGLELDELGGLALRSRAPATLSSTCTVFAESEVVGLLAAGTAREDIAAGLCRAVATRTLALAARLTVRPDVLVAGGVAYNEGVTHALAEQLRVPVLTPEQPQLVGAIGAAVIAAEKAGRHAPA